MEQLTATWPPQHHAYGIPSSTLEPQELALKFKDEKTSYIYYKSFDTLSIGDAREIKQLQNQKTQHPSLFIIKFSVINNEAQNALLKVLEEPTSNTFFYLIYPNFKQLLLTLQSRLEILELPELTDGIGDTGVLEVNTFVNAPLHERFEMIKKFNDKSMNDEKLTKHNVQQFLNELEQYYSTQKNNVQYMPLFDVLYDARRHVTQKGASLKMILDMVAVNLP
jgi:DNA polymerase III delta prime subunit